MALDVRSSELEHQFIKERITNVGKHFDEISSKLSSYIDKLASLTNSGDDVAKSITKFASKETCNQTTRLSFGEFSDILTSIQEYQDAQVQRILMKIKPKLDNFNPLCKQTKAEVKNCFDARNRELKKKDDLEKARSKNPPNWQKIAQVIFTGFIVDISTYVEMLISLVNDLLKAEKEVNQAQEEASRKTQELGRIVEQFERKKLEDLQHIFLEFTRIEMIFHAKAIEQYTKAYSVIKGIQVEEDLHEFISHFKSYTSCLNAEDLLPINLATIPKTVEDIEYPSPSYFSYKPQIIKSTHGTERSVFTLKTSLAHTANIDSSLESSAESKFESNDS